MEDQEMREMSYFLETLRFQIQGTSVLFEELFWNLTEMSIITILHSSFAFY